MGTDLNAYDQDQPASTTAPTNEDMSSTASSIAAPDATAAQETSQQKSEQATAYEDVRTVTRKLVLKVSAPPSGQSPSTPFKRLRSAPAESTSTDARKKRAKNISKHQHQYETRSKSLISLTELHVDDALAGFNAILDLKLPKLHLKRPSGHYPCHLLRLPQELRDHVYKYHMEDHPPMVDSKKSSLLCHAPLFTANKQIHTEMVYFMKTSAPVYIHVRNFHFDGVNSFLDKLTETDLKKFVPRNGLPALRTLTIGMSFGVCEKFAQDARLGKWREQCEELKKKGLMIDFEYECRAIDVGSALWEGRVGPNAAMPDLHTWNRSKTYNGENKLTTALKDGYKRFLGAKLKALSKEWEAERAIPE